MCDQQSLRSACAYAQSDQSLCLSLEYSMSGKLLTEQHLEFLSIKVGWTGSSESTLVKMPHCWRSHVAAHIYILLQFSTALSPTMPVSDLEVKDIDLLFLFEFLRAHDFEIID